MFFKRPFKYINLGRVIVEGSCIEEVVMVSAFGEGKSVAKAPFKLKISFHNRDYIIVDYDTWEERQEAYDFLWERLEEIK